MDPHLRASRSGRYTGGVPSLPAAIRFCIATVRRQVHTSAGTMSRWTTFTPISAPTAWLSNTLQTVILSHPPTSLYFGAGFDREQHRSLGRYPSPRTIVSSGPLSQMLLVCPTFALDASKPSLFICKTARISWPLRQVISELADDGVTCFQSTAGRRFESLSTVLHPWVKILRCHTMTRASIITTATTTLGAKRRKVAA